MSYQTRKSLSGFALAEMIISLAAVTLAIALVAGLGQQVMQLARSSKQTAAVVELRSKSTAITRNLDSWLSKLRSSPLTGGIYSACIPDPSNPVSVHFCPDVNPDLLANDSELKRIAGTQLHAASVPLLDMLGEKLAGTIDAPVLYDLDGRTCTSNCALKATGFMLRSNPASDSNPGSVRFVVKVEPHSRVKGQSPIRTSYLTIDVGSEWQQPTGLCPSGAIKVGYLSNGKPSCINPTKKCAAGTVHLGLDASANPICKTPPASCATSGGSIVINAEGNDLVCATNMSEIPCQASEIFLGYYAGTGVPMCSGTNLSCPDGEVQIGIRQEGAALQAQCKKLPSCNDSQKLSYDGSQFVCQSAQVASTCQAGEVVVGINEDGSVKCDPVERAPASETVVLHPSVKKAEAESGYRLLRLDANRIMIESFGDLLRFKTIQGKIYEATVKSITADLSSSSSGVSEASSSWFYLYLSLKENLGLRLRFSTLAPLAENKSALQSELGEYKYLGAVYNDASSEILPFTQSGNTFIFHEVQHQKPLKSQQPASGGLWMAWPGAVSKVKINLDFVPQTATFAKVQHFIQNERNAGCGWSTVFYVDNQSSPFQTFVVPSGDGVIANVSFDIPLQSQAQMGFYYQSVPHCAGMSALGQIISITGWVDGYLE